MVAALKVALTQRLKVEITYIDAYGEVSERVIHPTCFTDSAQKKMLNAWCELREEERNFRTDRIARIVLLEERFSERRRHWGYSLALD